MNLSDVLFRRTTFLVRDARAAAEFHHAAFGWPIWYDSEMKLDWPFPPTAVPLGATVRICILKPWDADFGMLGFMSYRDHDLPPTVDPARTTLGLGDTVLLCQVDDLEACFEKVKSAGGRINAPPTHWTVPAPGGGELPLYSFNFFDPNGLYVEVNKKI